MSVTTDANCICTVTAILPPSPPTDVPLDTLRRGEWQGVTRDKRPQLSGQNKTDLMPNNASCKRWDTLPERAESILGSSQCRGHPPVAFVLQSGSVEDVETYGHFAPGSAGNLTGNMGIRPFMLARNRRVEVRPLMRGAPRMQEFKDEHNRLFLPGVAAREVPPEAGELVGPIARPEPDHDASTRQDVDEGQILHHAHGLVERHRDHRGAEPDARGLGGQVAQVREHVRHDPVLVREVMLGHPGSIIAERLSRLDLRRHTGVDLPVRIGLAGRGGVRGEENPEFHAVSSLRRRFYSCPAQHASLHGTFLRRPARSAASSAMMNKWRAWDIIAHESA